MLYVISVWENVNVNLNLLEIYMYVVFCVSIINLKEG